MKICPKCQEKYEDTARFCNNCGERLETCTNVPPSSNSLPNVHGTEKKTYPFFLEDDEIVQAVIGEEAVASDLAGVYQKPYAVLSSKRLYIKNERGNFIRNTNEIQSIVKQTPIFSGKIIFWLGLLISFGLNFAVTFDFFNYGLRDEIFVPLLLLVCGVASAFFHIKRGTTIRAAILLLISSVLLVIATPIGVIVCFTGQADAVGMVLSIIIPILTLPVLIYLFIALQNKKHPGTLAIICGNDTYSFPLENYLKEESTNFVRWSPRNRHTPPKKRFWTGKAKIVKIVCGALAVVILVTVIILHVNNNPLMDRYSHRIDEPVQLIGSSHYEVKTMSTIRISEDVFRDTTWKQYIQLLKKWVADGDYEACYLNFYDETDGLVDNCVIYLNGDASIGYFCHYDSRRVYMDEENLFTYGTCYGKVLWDGEGTCEYVPYSRADSVNRVWDRH